MLADVYQSLVAQAKDTLMAVSPTKADVLVLHQDDLANDLYTNTTPRLNNAESNVPRYSENELQAEVERLAVKMFLSEQRKTESRPEDTENRSKMVATQASKGKLKKRKYR